MTLLEQIEELERKKEEQEALEEEERKREEEELPDPNSLSEKIKALQPDIQDYEAKDELSPLNIAKHAVTVSAPNAIRSAAALPLWAAKAVMSPNAAYEDTKVLEDLAYDMWNTPSNALPLAGMVAGGALGGAIGMPSIGAELGAAAGVAGRNWWQDRDWTKEDIGDIIMSPLSNLPFAAGSAAWKAARGTAKDVTKGSTLFTTHNITAEQAALANDWIESGKAMTDAKGNALERMGGLAAINAERERVNLKKAQALLDRLDPKKVDPGTTSMEQPGLISDSLQKIFEEPESFKQLSLFKKSEAGPRVPVKKEPIERSVTERADPNQLDLFKPTFMEQPDLPGMVLPEAERMSQRSLFQLDRFGKRVKKPLSERPDREKLPGPDLPNKAQGELFTPDTLEQLDLFPKVDKFRQQGLFPVKGRHMVLDDTDLDIDMSRPATPREKGNRFRQPILLPKLDKFKQLTLPKQEKMRQIAMFDKWNRATKTATEKVRPAEQLDLDLPFQTRPAPVMKAGTEEPTALYSTKNPPDMEQLGLDFPRTLMAAPEMKNGDVTSTLRSIKAARLGRQLKLTLPKMKELGVMAHSEDIPANRLFNTKKGPLPDTGFEPASATGLLGETLGLAKRKGAEAQPVMFPKPLKGAWYERAMRNLPEIREERKQVKIQRAREQVANHQAEMKARLDYEANLSKDPLMADLEADRHRMAQLSILNPEHLQPDVNPFDNALHKAGITASLGNPHLQLNNLGSHGYQTSQLIMGANDLYTTAYHKLRTLAHGVMDKYNVQEKDLKSHALLYTLDEHPELQDILKKVGTKTGPGKTFSARDAVQEFEALKGQRLNIKPQDYERLHNLHQFGEELREKALNPAWAFMLKQGADPAKVAQFNRRYMFSSFTSKRAAAEVQGDLQAIAKQYNSLSKAEKELPHGLMLKDQQDMLTEKLKMAMRASDKEDKLRADASQTLYKKGMKPGEIFNSAYHAKMTDMGFGTNMRSNMDDYLSGFLKKAIYDPTNAKLNDIIKQAPWDSGTKKWATALVLDQQGMRRKVQTQKMTEFAKRIPGIGSHIKDDSIENASNFLGQYNATVALGLNPKFYPINAMQNIVMGYGVVGGNGLAHGFASMIKNWPAAYKRAVNDGVIQSGLDHLWTEGKTTRGGNVITRFSKKMMEIPNKALQASEAVNRVWGNEAGHWKAAKEGLKGKEAVNRARDLNRMMNPGYSAAERPTASGTMTGSALLRYKGYSLQYMSHVRHLLKTDPKAAAETLAMVFALSGTNGIPGYGMIQDQFAKHLGVSLPTISPVDETMQSTNVGQSFSPWLTMPGMGGNDSLSDILGPVAGPPSAVVQSLLAGDTEALGTAVGQTIGGTPLRAWRAYKEYERGGLTSTPSGKPLIQRTPTDIKKYLFNVGTSAKGDLYRYNKEVERAAQVEDMPAIERAMEAARKGGVFNPEAPYKQVMADIRARERRKLQGKGVGGFMRKLNDE